MKFYFIYYLCYCSLKQLSKINCWPNTYTQIFLYHISLLTERNRNGPRGYNCRMHSEMFVHVRGHIR